MVVLIVSLSPWRSMRLLSGGRCLKTLLLRQPGMHRLLAKRRGFEAGV